MDCLDTMTMDKLLSPLVDILINGPGSAKSKLRHQNCSLLIRINDFGSLIMVFPKVLTLGKIRSK